MPQVSIACIQVNASPDMSKNIAVASDFIRQAHANGAEFIATPENVSMMEFGGQNVIATAYPQEDHPALQAFCALAKELGCLLLIGSLAIRLPNSKVANRSFLISSDGEITAQYDKIHMFDVDLGNGESYRESNTFDAGNTAVLASTPWGKLGMSVCYDLRFPHLYQSYAQAGATFLTVPAAFTRQTGEAHWHTLLRARAIETGSIVIAPGQCGTHKGDRQTYGHSLIIGPWGEILAEGSPETPGIISATVNTDDVISARAKIPNLLHGQAFTLTQS